MDLLPILASPFVLFALAILIGWLLYRWAKGVAPPHTAVGDKTMPYVGGEPSEAQTYQPGYQFFYVALFFTLIHVVALVIAVAPPGSPLWATTGYLAVALVAVMILRWEQ